MSSLAKAENRMNTRILCLFAMLILAGRSANMCFGSCDDDTVSAVAGSAMTSTSSIDSRQETVISEISVHSDPSLVRRIHTDATKVVLRAIDVRQPGLTVEFTVPFVRLVSVVQRKRTGDVTARLLVRLNRLRDAALIRLLEARTSRPCVYIYGWVIAIPPGTDE